ncbi:site-specific recombinase [Xylophilus ampelinus]|uniref:Site-specific recombinase n=1 Tax=Xylophilus ampelinus TaxID=54067 RepID=A0A318SC87_9BURK|nr:site-specific recombinase [Xylophilus ampelinus]MCS4511686.1 site-specific recombinase [Xylophilus ampelinus]PYE74202.1 site-specific recombinase [Xylophilus ampelinus]
MRSKRDLNGILERLDPAAPLAVRHLWLIELADWIRGKGATPQAAVSRVQLLLDAVESRPEVRLRLRAWWSRLLHTVDITTLLADFGFAPRSAFVSEASERIRRKILPTSPETIDASELFLLALPHGFDAQWISLLDGRQRRRIADLLAAPDTPQPAAGATAAEPGGPGGAIAPATTHTPDLFGAPAATTPVSASVVEAPLPDPWQQALLDALMYCAGQVLSTGFAPELRLRMNAAAREAQPFHALIRDVEALRVEAQRLPRDDAALERAARQLRARLDACRFAAATVYTHLEENGVSVGLVFRLRQLRERLLRIRELLDCALSADAPAAAARLLSRLVLLGHERRSVRALISANSSLLAAKVAERSAETGEHYITRDSAAYGRMLRQAAGGGVLTAGTVLGKFAITAVGLSAFWTGIWSSLLYAGSFVLIQLLHCTLATKQPAMTAPAMAAKLKEMGPGASMDSFVDEVTHLVRSQVAAVLGNVFTVFPVVLAAAALLQVVMGHPMISPREAQHTLESLTLLGPTAFFAAFTGVLLFSASIVAGWAENWFVLHRLDSAMRFNPRITRWLGAPRAARLAHFVRQNVSGFASNVSLGFMLGMIPPLIAFVGIGLEARHVTLSTGQIAAAAAAYGTAVLHMAAFWWCLAAIPAIGALNLIVSFTLAFRLALRAHNVGSLQRARIRSAIWARLRHAPLSFFVPRGSPAPNAGI